LIGDDDADTFFSLLKKKNNLSDVQAVWPHPFISGGVFFVLEKKHEQNATNTFLGVIMKKNLSNFLL
jgi:hypothetical protein